ncbi:MAG: hypothetical protein K6C68_13635 [Ruminococcus sp.]|nr:hypothetical protein [Ruminococcus sp.]
MFKRFLSGLTALAMILSIGSVAAFADEGEEPDTADEIIADILSDEEFLESDNYMVQELLREIACEESELTEMDSGEIHLGDISEPQWGSSGTTDSDHANIVKAVMDRLNKKISDSKKATVSRCMIYASYKADNPLMHNASLKIVQLHGIKNYVAHLKALWKYSKLIYSHDENYCRTKVIEYLPNYSSTNSEDLETLLDTIPLIFTFYQSKYGHTPDSLEKKYLVVGLALHLIGDIYAHRTCVPILYSSDSYYNNNIEPYIKSNMHTQLKAEINDGNFYCTKFEKSGYIDPNKIGTLSQNQVFEDNPDFLPERYECSITSSVNFVDSILNSSSFVPSDILINNSINVYGVPNIFPMKLYKYSDWVSAAN